MPAARQRIEQAQGLIALRSAPTWPILHSIVTDKISVAFRRFCSPEKLSEQDMNYKRGFISGLREVLDLVEGAEKKLAELTKEP